LRTRYISCNQWLATVPCDAPASQRHIHLSRTLAAMAVAFGLVLMYSANRHLVSPFLRYAVTIMGVIMVLGHGQRLAFYTIDRPTYLTPCQKQSSFASASE
jgi:hypothetical protein